MHYYIVGLQLTPSLRERWEHMESFRQDFLALVQARLIKRPRWA